MSVDPRWRARVEGIRRAGLEYVDRKRLASSPTPALATEPEGAVRPTAMNRHRSESAVAENGRGAEPSLSEGSDPHATASPFPSMSLEEKSSALKVLADEVAGCTRCSTLAASRTQTVFSDGTPAAEICFVGEAPGADEDAQGIPFVGKAGQLLTKIIEACKLKREDVYICNVLKCRPPGNRNPAPDEVECCRGFLDRQLEIIRPKMIVALGKFAAAYLLNKPPEQVPITKLRGQIREYRGIPVMITLHPAYLLRNPPAKREVWEDMKRVMREIGRPIDETPA